MRGEPLNVGAAIEAASTTEAGGIGVFVGTVRSSAAVPGRSDDAVTELQYDAHVPLADARLDEIARAAADKWRLHAVTALHRTGTCGLGEPTVVVVCSAAHRAEALDACRWMIDEIKATVPIFKREVYEDGSAWVGTEDS
ncbi:MAG TPA: molybdenum cofactor biosynthesis protein MoaE [Actinomycetota bacterium]|jgi:molybdopterin synthase catalytic subunit